MYIQIQVERPSGNEIKIYFMAEKLLLYTIHFHYAECNLLVAVERFVKEFIDESIATLPVSVIEQ